jgi:hypothetical protein
MYALEIRIYWTDVFSSARSRTLMVVSGTHFYMSMWCMYVCIEPCVHIHVVYVCVESCVYVHVVYVCIEPLFYRDQ